MSSLADCFKKFKREKLDFPADLKEVIEKDVAVRLEAAKGSLTLKDAIQRRQKQKRPGIEKEAVNSLLGTVRQSKVDAEGALKGFQEPAPAPAEKVRETPTAEAEPSPAPEVTPEVPTSEPSVTPTEPETPAQPEPEVTPEVSPVEAQVTASQLQPGDQLRRGKTLHTVKNVEVQPDGKVKVEAVGVFDEVVLESDEVVEVFTGLDPKGVERFKKSAFFRFLARKLRARGGLPQKAFEAKVQAEGIEAAVVREVDFLNRELQGAVNAKAGLFGRGRDRAKAEILRQAQRVMVGEAPLDTLPEELHEIVPKMRKAVDTLSQQLIDSGFVQDDALADIIRENIGTYYNRSYHRWTDPDKWAKRVPQQAKDAAKDFLKTEIGQEPGETNEDYEKRIDTKVEYLLLGKDALTPWGALATTFGRKNFANLKKRQDIPKPIRDLWGERVLADENLVKTMTQMARQIAAHHFLTTARDAGMDSFFFNEPAPGFVKKISSEGDKGLEPLAGLYTSQEIIDALHRFMSTDPSALLRVWQTLNGWPKVSKTILSQITHVRNFVSNILIFAAHGHFFAGLSGVKKAVPEMARDVLPDRLMRWVTGKFSGDSRAAIEGIDQEIKKYARYGVIDDATSASEMKAVLKESLAGDVDLVVFSDGKLKKLGKSVLRVSQRLYQAEDAFWKVMAFENERSRLKKAWPDWTNDELDAEAARVVRATMPVYSLVPEGVKDLRRFPLLGTFVSFTSEMIRTNINSIRQIKQEIASPNPKAKSIGLNRLASWSFAHSLPLFIAEFSKRLMGVGDDEEEAIRVVAAPWDQNGTLVFLPGGKKDQPAYINLSYTDPFGMFKDAGRAFWRGIEDKDVATGIVRSTGELLEPFASEELFTEAMIDLARNKTSGGQPVWNEADSSGDIARKVVNHLINPFMPGTVGVDFSKSLSPEMIGQVGRLKKAALNQKSKTGRSYDPEKELLSMAAGLRIVEVDPANSMFFKSQGFMSRKRDSSKIFNSVARRRGEVSDEELATAYRRMIQARNSNYRDYQDVIKALEVLGLPRADIIKAAKAARIGDVDLRFSFRDKIPPYKISGGLVDDLRKIKGRVKQVSKLLKEVQTKTKSE